MDNLLKGLNKEQLKAVTHSDGPALVIAGAGTGKTTVITRRVAWLIGEKKIAPSNILALTFTEKAAGEMEERVDKLVPYGYVDTWISTFHAFCDRILRDNSLTVGLTANYKVLSQPEQAVFLRERIFSLDISELRPTSDPRRHIPAIVEHINRLKDELITPERYACFAESYAAKAKEKEELSLSQKYLELATLYNNYQQWSRESDNIDFGDQIMLVVSLLEEHPELLRKYQNQFQYCLVDEFQDTNVAQNKLLQLLFGGKTKRQNIFVVGDDDQSIYQFRGAAVQNILDFKKNWPSAQTIVLNKNYRSVQPILDKAYSLISNNNPNRLEVAAGINKKLIGTGAGREPEFHRYDDDYFESKAIVERIIEYVDGGNKYKDIAILTRTNNQLDSAIRQLRAARVPFISPSSSGLYDEPIIKLIISFVRTLSNYDDYVSLYYLATSDVYGASTRAMTAIISLIRYKNMHLRKALENVNDNAELKERAGGSIESINKLTADIETYTEMSRDSNVGEVIYEWLKKTGLLKKIIARADKDDVNAQVDLENIAGFYEKIKNFIRASDNPNIMNFVDNLRLLMDAGENPSLNQIDIDINAVTLSTVHSAKGLEWPLVFLPSLCDDRFPARHRAEALPLPAELSKSVDKDTHLQEERRLFYVALTRAKKNVVLSCAKRYDNNVRDKKISRFVVETMGSNVKQDTTARQQSAVEKLSLFDTNLKAPAQALCVNKKFARLNPHQIDDYLTCPKKFEYVHVHRVPINTNWQVVYGNILHTVIGYYFANKLQGNIPPISDLLTLYEKSWKSDGYETHEQEAEKKRLGLLAVENFYSKQQKSADKILAVEEPFEFELKGVRISGRFDTIFLSGGVKSIVDFKTSDIREQKKGIERVKKSTQMQVYALAGENMDGAVPETALYFVESGIVSKYKFKDKEIEKIKDKIVTAAEGINAQKYDATPGINQCHWCAFKDICPYKYKGA